MVKIESSIYKYYTWFYTSGKFRKVFDSSSEASSLLVGWIYSLFLVTAVKKLPSAGARWHAAS